MHPEGKKMKKHIHIIFMLILLIFTSCGNEETRKGKVIIMGDYSPSVSKVYLNKVHANNVKLLDSADISGGQAFIFSVNSQDEALFRLEQKDLYPLLIVGKNGDTIKIQQTDDPAWPYLVEGNNECMMLAAYLERLKRDEHKVDSLSVIFMNSQSHPDFLAIRDHLNQEFINIHEEHKQWARNFVTRYPSSFASLVMINSFFREFLLFDQTEDFSYYELVANAVMDRMPENRYAIDLNEQVGRIREAIAFEAEAEMRLSPGRKVPEFQLKTIDGAKVGPQNLIEKNVLIYFWAATDAKSRQTNPLIKKIYEAFYDKGLEVLAISFDQSGEAWQNAIRLDSLPGIHICDASGARSPVQNLFNIKMQLPMYFLMDTEGRIFKHSRDFNDLPQSVYELVGEWSQN